MAKCNWDPSKHEGRPCPIHGSGMWDENILTRKDKIEKLKEKGYTQEEIEEELKDEKFDEDFDWEEKEEVKEEFDKDDKTPVYDEDDKPTEGLLDHDDKYKYALLDRLRSDAEYYLNAKVDKYLWSGNPEQHIIDMRALYNSFDDNKKPEWLSEEKINEYEKEFKKIKQNKE